MISIFILLSSIINAQLLDVGIELPIKDSLFFFEDSDRFTVSAKFEIPETIENPGGVALRFSCPGNVIVSFSVISLDKNDTSSHIPSLFYEPYSDRVIGVFNQDLIKGSEINFNILSSNEINFISLCILDSKNNDVYPDTHLSGLYRQFGNIQKPNIITRQEWDANPPKYTYSQHPYFDRLTLHHAAGWQAWTIDQGKAQVKAIQEFHQDGRGWSDIGYHFLVDMGGNIYQGRPESVIGAHVGGANTGNIGVCILGCYHPPETSWACYNTLTNETENALIHLYAWIAENYFIDPQVLLGHRDYFGNTACPGDNVWPLITEMRDEISIFIASGGPPVTFRLLPNFPNPFNSVTTIPFYSESGNSAKISITDVIGREIVVFEEKNIVRGYNEVSWNGIDKSGLEATSGIYLYEVVVGSGSGSNRMVFLK